MLAIGFGCSFRHYFVAFAFVRSSFCYCRSFTGDIPRNAFRGKYTVSTKPYCGYLRVCAVLAPFLSTERPSITNQYVPLPLHSISRRLALGIFTCTLPTAFPTNSSCDYREHFCRASERVGVPTGSQRRYTRKTVTDTDASPCCRHFRRGWTLRGRGAAVLPTSRPSYAVTYTDRHIRHVTQRRFAVVRHACLHRYDNSAVTFFFPP